MAWHSLGVAALPQPEMHVPSMTMHAATIAQLAAGISEHFLMHVWFVGFHWHRGLFAQSATSPFEPHGAVHTLLIHSQPFAVSALHAADVVCVHERWPHEPVV